MGLVYYNRDGDTPELGERTGCFNEILRLRALCESHHDAGFEVRMTGHEGITYHWEPSYEHTVYRLACPGKSQGRVIFYPRKKPNYATS